MDARTAADLRLAELPPRASRGLVLIGVIVIAAVRGHGGVLIGPFVAALAAVIVQIVRYDT